MKIILWGSVKSCFPFSDKTSTTVTTTKSYKLSQNSEKLQKFQLTFLNMLPRKEIEARSINGLKSHIGLFMNKI